VADAAFKLSADEHGAALFYARRDSGLFKTINHYLLMDLRVAEGRDAPPSAGVINSQSVKTTESGGIRGYDAGTKIKVRKRYILTDTCGYLVHAVIHAADIQNRDGAPLALKDALAKIGTWSLEIIKRSDAAKGFILLPRRWLVERTFAWLNRNRRLAKDFERTIESATAWLFFASIQLITRRVVKP
jgi:putative transposase